jgi:hypothetical protein
MSDFYVIQTGAEYPQSYADCMVAAEARLASLQAERPGAWEIIECDAWIAAREARYLDKPAEEITHDRFWDMLGCLPPLYVPCGDMDHRFNMSEFQFGRVTSQFAEIGGRYFTKYVRHGDAETYLTRATVAAL